MKHYVYVIILIVILSGNLFSQTFSNSTATATGSWDGTLTRTISVTGVGVLSATNVLKQVNLHMGGASESTRNFGTYTVTLYSPNSTTINVIQGSISFPTTFYNEFNIKIRDNSTLRFPSTTTTSELSQPWNIGYYRTPNSNAFSTFNTINADGTWTVTISESSSSSGAKFNKVDLIFGTPFTITNITGSTANDACSSAQCVDASSIWIATVNGYTGNTSTDPNISSPLPGGCDWNAARNNSAWFYFRPSATTCSLTISGITNLIQSLVIAPTNSCTAGSQSVPTGGCPSSATNDTYYSPRYTSSSGSAANQQFRLSGLTSGVNYVLIIDGNGGAISDLYIELQGSYTTCSVILPIELSQFDYNCLGDELVINWTTLSEKDNDYFTLLGSNDGVEWFDVVKINGAGNSTSINPYSFTVPSNYSDTKYFKLKQTDFDGKTSYSQIIDVNCQNFDAIDFYPNPFNNELVINLKHRSKVDYEIYNNLGQIITSGIVSQNATSVDLSQLASGVYYIKVNQTKTYKLLKN